MNAHGTPAAYQQHIAKSEDPCPDCARANREYTRAWRIRSGRTPSVAIPVEAIRDYADAGCDIAELLCAVFPAAVVDAILEPTQVAS